MRKLGRTTLAKPIGDRQASGRAKGSHAQEQGAPPKPKFRGSLARLRDVVLRIGIDGEWDERPNRVWRFRCEDGAGMNWSSTKGTLWFDGPAAPRERLQEALVSALRAGVGGLFRS